MYICNHLVILHKVLLFKEKGVVTSSILKQHITLLSCLIVHTTTPHTVGVCALILNKLECHH